MKKVLIISTLLLTCYLCRAQNSRVDSLLAQIEKTDAPKKINAVIHELVTIPQGSIALLKRGRQDLEKAENTGTSKDKERALLMISGAAFDLRYAPELLNATLQGARISRELKDSVYLEHFLQLTGLANFFQQDIPKACSYFKAAAAVALAIHDTGALMADYSNLESSYANRKMTDSAIYIARLEMKIAGGRGAATNHDDLRTAYGDYGEALMGANKPDSALLYYRYAYQLTDRNVKPNDFSYMENVMAIAYLKTGKLDSAAKYGLEAYQVALKTNYWEFKANAAGTLAQVYDGRDYKKSLFYLKAEMTAKDSINATEKARHFNMIAEQDRQHDEELKVAQDSFNARIHLYIVIGAAIVLLLIGIILLRNNRRQRQTNLLLNEQKEEIEAQRDNLAGKNRELEIETALEKVRTVALAMQQPDDMLEVCRTICGQLELLGVKEIRNVQTAIIYEERGIYINYEYYCLYKKTFITEVDYGHPIQADFVKKMLVDGGYQHLSLKGLELKDWYEYQKTTNQFIDTHLAEVESLNYYWFSIGPVALGISLYKPLNEENIDLFKRFVEVFRLAYRRYKDIELAMEQAKEAQIELALERVRARTMAMQHSDELAETAYILFQQFKELGENPDQATIGIINEEEWVIEYWVTMYGSQTNKVFKFSMDEPNVTRRIYDGWKAKEKSLVIDLTGKELYDFSNYRASMGGAAFNPDEHRRVVNVAFFSKGLINVQSTESRSAESIKLLERFAAVFEQTYTRFLDLQKAEAQAREGKIELALERVRAKTMAMQHSNELLATSQLLFEQLTELGETADQMSIGIVNEQEGFFELFATLHGNPMLQVFKPPLDEPYMMGKVYKAWKAQEKSFLIEIAGEELRNYNIHRNSIAKTKYYSEDIGPDDRWVLCGSSFSKGLLGFSSSKTPAKEDRALLERFANVFEQTYTRFLDLKKAEAQAREAQIEAGLERVRSRTMGMQKSDELAETLSLLFKQLLGLGIKTEQIRTCGIVTFDVHQPIGEQWITETNGDIIPQSFMVPYDEAPAYKAIYQGWKKGEKFMVIHLEGQALKEHLGYLIKGTNVPTRDVVRPQQATEIYNHVMFFSQGCLFIITKEALPGYHDVFKRFGAVFQQSYTRFLDLQKAEAQAKEAQIEAALERVRSRSMGMRNSEELTEIIKVVYEQFVHLNMPVEHTGFIIDYNTRDDMHIWLADKHYIPSEITIPYFDSPHWNSFVEAKEKGIDFFTNHLTFEEKNKFYDDLFKLVPGVDEETKAYYDTCPGLDISTVLLDTVGLYIENFSGVPYTDEENNTLMRFGKVFQQTYTRFNDLKKAEEQAREAVIEASLERVRSKTMAMHNSNDVADTVTLMFNELIKLGVDKIARCGIAIPDNNGLIELWTAKLSKDEKEDMIIGHINTAIHPMIRLLYDAWKSKHANFEYILEGDDLDSYITALNNYPGYPIKYDKGAWGAKQYHNDFFFNEGMVFAFTFQPLSTEIAAIFKRFSGVFGQTYRRFLDLQKAESQAREAQIEASLERVRGKAMAMRDTNDLSVTVSMVFTELRNLGINPIRAGVGQYQERQKKRSFMLLSRPRIKLPFH